MSRARMLAHIGALIWHAREAIAEATHPNDMPPLVHAIVNAEPSEIGVDEGYVQDAAAREEDLWTDA